MHARFNEIVDNYGEQNVLRGNGKLGLCGMLLAGELMKKEPNNSSDGENAVSSYATASSTGPAPNVRILLLSKNGFVSKKLLQNRIFVLAGLFYNVSLHRKTTEEDIKNMINLLEVK